MANLRVPEGQYTQTIYSMVRNLLSDNNFLCFPGMHKHRWIDERVATCHDPQLSMLHAKNGPGDEVTTS